MRERRKIVWMPKLNLDGKERTYSLFCKNMDCKGKQSGDVLPDESIS